MDDYRINITSDTAGDILEVSSVGSVDASDESVVITYVADGTETMLEVMRDCSGARLIHKGVLNIVMDFFMKDTTDTVLTTDFGSFTVRIVTHEITADIADGKVGVKVRYAIDFLSEIVDFVISVTAEKLTQDGPSET